MCIFYIIECSFLLGKIVFCVYEIRDITESAMISRESIYNMTSRREDVKLWSH